MIRSVTYTADGSPILAPDGAGPLERVITTTKVATNPPLSEVMFDAASSPPVPRPELPEVPFEAPFFYAKDRTVVLRCLGPDGHRYRMELDTGANVGLLTNSAANRLGLEPVGAERVTGHGGVAEVRYAWAAGFKLEGMSHSTTVELPPWLAAVLNEDRGLESALQDSGVAGLLGVKQVKACCHCDSPHCQFVHLFLFLEIDGTERAGFLTGSASLRLEMQTSLPVYNGRIRQGTGKGDINGFPGIHTFIVLVGNRHRANVETVAASDTSLQIHKPCLLLQLDQEIPEKARHLFYL